MDRLSIGWRYLQKMAKHENRFVQTPKVFFILYLESKSGKKVVSKENYLQEPQNKKRLNKG